MNTNVLELKNLIDGFRLSCQTEGKSPKTVEWYISFLARFAGFLERGGMPAQADRIDRTHIRAFIRYLQTEARTLHGDAPLSPATVQGYVRTLKAFFSWLEREDYIATNPMTRVPIPRAPIKIINTFTPEQIQRLADVCLRSSGIGSRNLCILLLMLDTGIRVSELANIHLGDVDLDGGYITISQAKGGRERIVPVGSLVQKSLWKYMNQVRPEAVTPMVTRLFLNKSGLPLTKNGIQQMLRRYGKRAGIDGVRCSPHTFRHTFAKNYLLNGGDIFSLQRILGHSSLASVRMYLNLFAADVKRQHERFSPVDNLVVTSRASLVTGLQRRALLGQKMAPAKDTMEGQSTATSNPWHVGNMARPARST